MIDPGLGRRAVGVADLGFVRRLMETLQRLETVMGTRMTFCRYGLLAQGVIKVL